METNKIELGVVSEKNGKIVSEASIARKLLKDGYHIIDIKPKRGHARESVYVFENVAGFMDKFEQYVNERKERFTKKED